MALEDHENLNLGGKDDGSGMLPSSTISTDLISGNILMNYDSQIAEQVMLHFAKKGIPALPVHDSFVVPVDYADECWDVMLDAFQDVMTVEFSERGGQAISIDGSYVQGVMNAMKRVRVLDRSPEWDRA